MKLPSYVCCYGFICFSWHCATFVRICVCVFKCERINECTHHFRRASDRLCAYWVYLVVLLMEFRVNVTEVVSFVWPLSRKLCNIIRFAMPFSIHIRNEMKMNEWMPKCVFQPIKIGQCPVLVNHNRNVSIIRIVNDRANLIRIFFSALYPNSFIGQLIISEK